MFNLIADYLNERTAQRERVVKCSRELTIYSKNLIFLLQRLSSSSEPSAILEEADYKFKHIKENLISRQLCDAIVGTSKLGGDVKRTKVRDQQDIYVFYYNWRQGLQEYVEACVFHHFLKYDQVISYEQLVESQFYGFNDTSLVDSIPLPPADYLLGVADFTGELMRFCIGAISNGQFEKAERYVQVLRQLTEDFTMLEVYNLDEMQRKMSTMRASLQKCEFALYQIRLLQFEYTADQVNEIVRQGSHIASNEAD
ncbi:hypothetical protein MP228_003801 [Amoeboaphelidium protococcarum]|nr:hypothetical protein MP228_003801 [Amoeboaphelidium protococcarum]